MHLLCLCHQVGQTVMVSGPDTTTTCGNPRALLTINEQYVVGVGSVCGAISPWSTLQSYSPNDLQTLRAFSRDFQAGSLTCGALAFIPSLSIIAPSIVLVVIINLLNDSWIQYSSCMHACQYIAHPVFMPLINSFQLASACVQFQTSFIFTKDLLSSTESYGDETGGCCQL